MTPDRVSALLRRVGFGDAPPDLRVGRRVVAIVLAVYVASFALFYPTVATNHDEANYIRQAKLVLTGSAEITQIDPFSGEPTPVVLATYALGPALMMAPLYAVFGERGVFVIPCLALVLAVWFTGLWIASEGRSPLFALVMLGFPALLVLGRVAMSDVPSTGWVAVGLWLFWRGIEGRPGWWLASGFMAGASWSLRATNPLLFLPLFAGTVLRREKKAAALVVGGLAGLGVRLLSQLIFFGNALHERSGYRFAPDTLDERLPLYLLGLLVFVPGGLVFSALYRGRRRPEIVFTIIGFFLFYLLQQFSSVATSQTKRVVLALRYLLPMLPLVAFAMSESLPRLWKRWRASSQVADSTARRRRLDVVTASVLVAWLAGVGVAAAAVHPAYAMWSATQGKLRRAIQEYVPDDAVMVTNRHGTKKFTREIGRRFRTLDTYVIAPADILELVAKHEQVFLVLMDRSDSARWEAYTRRNAEFFDALPTRAELLADVRPTSVDRLRIWRLSSEPTHDGRRSADAAGAARSTR